jgi:very-short-patch-repair endonuclease
MSKPMAYDLIKKGIVDRITAELDCEFQDVVGDSEIEKLFYYGLYHCINAGLWEHKHLRLFSAKEEDRASVFSDKATLVIEPQAQLDGWRVDFLLYSFDFGIHPGHRAGWNMLIVECDGHDFHERTKEQAAKDRSRDRWAQSKGVKIFRFTGSELWRDPMKCLEDVHLWAVDGW